VKCTAAKAFSVRKKSRMFSFMFQTIRSCVLQDHILFGGDGLEHN